MPQYQDQIRTLKSAGAARRAQIESGADSAARRHLSPTSGAGQAARRVDPQLSHQLAGAQEAIDRQENDALMNRVRSEGRALSNYAKTFGANRHEQQTANRRSTPDVLREARKRADVPGMIQQGLGYLSRVGPSGNQLPFQESRLGDAAAGAAYSQALDQVAFSGQDIRSPEQYQLDRMRELYGDQYVNDILQLERELQSARRTRAVTGEVFADQAGRQQTEQQLQSGELGLNADTLRFGTTEDIQKRFGPGARIDPTTRALVRPERVSAEISDGNTTRRYLDRGGELMSGAQVRALQTDPDADKNAPAEIKATKWYANNLFGGDLQKGAEFYRQLKNKSGADQEFEVYMAAYEAMGDTTEAEKAVEKYRAFTSTMQDQQDNTAGGVRQLIGPDGRAISVIVKDGIVYDANTNKAMYRLPSATAAPSPDQKPNPEPKPAKPEAKRETKPKERPSAITDNPIASARDVAGQRKEYDDTKRALRRVKTAVGNRRIKELSNDDLRLALTRSEFSSKERREMRRILKSRERS